MAAITLLLSLAPTASNAEWVLFDLLRSPIYDARGSVVEAKRVVKFRKPLFGAMILYPDLSDLNVTEKYDTGRNLLIKTDAVDMKENRKAQYVTVNTVSKQRKASPLKTASYGWKDFKARTVTAEEAERLKLEWEFVKEDTEESGITR